MNKQNKPYQPVRFCPDNPKHQITLIYILYVLLFISSFLIGILYYKEYLKNNNINPDTSLLNEYKSKFKMKLTTESTSITKNINSSSKNANLLINPLEYDIQFVNIHINILNNIELYSENLHFWNESLSNDGYWMLQNRYSGVPIYNPYNENCLILKFQIYIERFSNYSTNLYFYFTPSIQNEAHNFEPTPRNESEIENYFLNMVTIDLEPGTYWYEFISSPINLNPSETYNNTWFFLIKTDNAATQLLLKSGLSKSPIYFYSSGWSIYEHDGMINYTISPISSITPRILINNTLNNYSVNYDYYWNFNMSRIDEKYINLIFNIENWGNWSITYDYNVTFIQTIYDVELVLLQKNDESIYLKFVNQLFLQVYIPKYITYIIPRDWNVITVKYNYDNLNYTETIDREYKYINCLANRGLYEFYIYIEF